MSATAPRSQGAGGTRAGRAWLDSVRDEALRFLSGDNNAPWAILAETALGCVPILGQVIDARDIIKGLAEVGDAPDSQLAWFNLVTAVVGLIPGGGDAVKRGARAVKSGTLNIDDLLALVRRYHSGDPEQLVRQVLDPGRIVAKLEEVLASPALQKSLSPEVQRRVQRIRSGIAAQAAALRKEVDDWFTRGRKTSAGGAGAAKPTVGAPPAKPATQVGEGSKARGQHSDAAAHTTPNSATQRMQRLKDVGNRALGVFGEHMADYHCQDVKGWYATARVGHDQGHINIAKMNDGGVLVQLWPLNVRGRGIDAVWRTEKGPRPYAIVEAKASVDPSKGLGQLLDEAWDKNDEPPHRNAPVGGKQRGGRFGSRARTTEADTVRQKNGKVTQMSHGWIAARVARAVSHEEAVLKTFKKLKDRAYSRHVLFCSMPQGATHAEALISAMAGRALPDDTHNVHELTREWLDDDIERVVNQRAGNKPPNTGRGR